MLLLRRIDNPLIIKASGEVEPGGLGEYDASVYEEAVVDWFPAGALLESPVRLGPKINELVNGLAPNDRALFYTGGAHNALAGGDYEVVDLIVQSQEFSPLFKQQLASLIANGVEYIPLNPVEHDPIDQASIDMLSEPATATVDDGFSLVDDAHDPVDGDYEDSDRDLDDDFDDVPADQEPSSSEFEVEAEKTINGF